MARKSSINIDLEGLNLKAHRGLEDPRARLFREIKAHYAYTKRKAMAGLTLENNKVTIKERLLRNLSQNYKETWKKLQNKTLFLSLLRISLMSTRLFGILSFKVGQRKITEGPKRRLDRLSIRQDSLTVRTHHILMFLLLVYALALFPVDLAFDAYRGVPQFESVYALVYTYLFVDICLKFFFKLDLGERPSSDVSPAVMYLRGWFAWDLIMSLPFYFMWDTDVRWLRKITLAPMAFRILLSVCTKSPINNICFQKMVGLFGFGKLASVRLNILSILMFMHLSACVWIFFISVDPVHNWYVK